MTTSTSTGAALVIGEALIDIVGTGNGEPVEYAGGSPMNVAVGLARLGRPVTLVTAFGRDARGERLRVHLESEHVTVAPGSDSASRTTTARAHIGADGVATYEFDVDWNPPEVAPEPNVWVVHAGSYSATAEPGATQVRELVTDARSHATITYDPNARPSLMGTPQEARAQMERLIDMADVVKVSDEDIEWIAAGTDPLVVAEAWLRQGPAIVIVTRGGDGAVALTAGGLTVAVEGEQVEVVDTVGAGDSFMSGMIDGLWTAGLLGAENREALGEIDRDTLTDILQRCVRIAGITVSRAGANPPRSDELA